VLEKQEGDNNPDNALCRYEFLEVVVRLAKAKYMETGVTKSYSESVKLLFNNNINKFDQSEPW
jgi:hypothetical protein